MNFLKSMFSGLFEKASCGIGVDFHTPGARYEVHHISACRPDDEITEVCRTHSRSPTYDELLIAERLGVTQLREHAEYSPEILSGVASRHMDSGELKDAAKLFTVAASGYATIRNYGEAKCALDKSMECVKLIVERDKSSKDEVRAAQEMMSECLINEAKLLLFSGKFKEAAESFSAVLKRKSKDKNSVMTDAQEKDAIGELSRAIKNQSADLGH
jgi:tetratricopeptide (TPR) repeat protein